VTQLETLHPEEMSYSRNLGDADVYTLAGLDDDRDSIDLQPSPIHGSEYSSLDGGDPGCRALGLDVSSTRLFCHTSALPDVSRFYDTCATLDQPVLLDLDSDDDEGMEKEEAVLNFQETT
jgi:hypothetical protein